MTYRKCHVSLCAAGSHAGIQLCFGFITSFYKSRGANLAPLTGILGSMK